MSKRGGGAYWPASVLKGRGWTNELMKQLLPKPRFVMSNGHPVRMWSKEDVSRAESSLPFSNGRIDPKAARGGQKGSAPGVKHARSLLSQAWEEAERDGSAPWRMAGYCHAALMARLTVIPRSRAFGPSQAR